MTDLTQQPPVPAPPLSRADVLNAIIGLFESPRYLEVGVWRGDTFHAVRAASKIAVDPRFRFDVVAAKRDNPHAYAGMTSDRYFSEVIDPNDEFDLIFLDGLHTFDQTLRDLMNALAYIKRGGVIVIDDILPSSYVAAIPDWDIARDVRTRLGIADPTWMGDVYKLVFFIHSFMPQFEYRSVEGNHGQLVMWRKQRVVEAPRGVREISDAEYATAALNVDVFRFEPLGRIVERMHADGIGRRAPA